MSLLHSGVVVNGKEYAYGGHDQAGISGVYWTSPGTVPPGGTFRSETLHGFTFAPQAEIDAIIREVSNEFQGTAYNILTRNCNHFASSLCQRLTGRAAPAWLNRAAGIGLALPCVVPREWIEPPDYSNADGELVEEEYVDERSRMLDQADQLRSFATELGSWEGSSIDTSSGVRGGGTGRAPRADVASMPR
jgi:hypothetical protein